MKHFNLPQDPDNPGWVKGWGVFQNDPWDFEGLYLDKAEAEVVRADIGDTYEIAYGTHRVGSTDFIVESVDPY
ncbi:hypothetical protein EBB56_13395 [Halomonas sp. YLB-10]|uniref:hypothetical protein n=1 Tax=Halomonas sp. YLB-10 TaxID=2483111 RepID=UPI000F603788|nr:hypothetical protein [Halomonas sp. YLB-10]RQW70339.1 hypothetical protein EBB56_13395 [Halomonas sp. YLB-10]